MNRLCRFTMLAIIGFGILAPFFVVAGVSIGASKTISFPPTSLSIIWYQELLTDPDWLSAIGASLFIALCAALIAVLLALMINYLLWRTHTRFSVLVFALGFGPFLLPPIILALGATLFWAEVGLYGRIEATIVSHGIFLTALPLVILTRGFATITDEVVEAAQMMGATSWKLFVTIVLPLITPYLITGYALVFVISVNEYLIANMVSGFVVETLPIKIFNNVRYGYSPVVAAAAMLFVGITVCVLLLVSRITDLLTLLGVRSET